MSERADQIVLEYLRRVADAAHGVLRSDERLDFLARLRRRIDDMRVRQRADKPAQVQRIIARFGDPDALVEQERLRLAAEHPEDPRFAARQEARRTTMLGSEDRGASGGSAEEEADATGTSRQAHPGRTAGQATTTNASGRTGGGRAGTGPANTGRASGAGTGAITPRLPSERPPNETQPIPVLGPTEYAETHGAEYAYVADYSDDLDDLVGRSADEPDDAVGDADDTTVRTNPPGRTPAGSTRAAGSAGRTGSARREATGRAGGAGRDVGGGTGTSGRDADDTSTGATAAGDTSGDPGGGSTERRAGAPGRGGGRAGATGTRRAYPRRAAPSDVWTVSGRALPGAGTSRRRSAYLDLAQRNKVAAVAIVLLGFGALALPVPLWLVGVALLIVARPWTMGDKLLAAALPIVTVAVYGLATDHAAAVLNLSAYLPGGSGSPRLAFGIGGLIGAGYLAVRLNRTATR